VYLAVIILHILILKQEGWLLMEVLKQDSFAKLVLTYSLPLDAKIDSSVYYDLVNTRAKVTIFDGEQSEVLVLIKRKIFFRLIIILHAL
jgi:hypothetical protein